MWNVLSLCRQTLSLLAENKSRSTRGGGWRGLVSYASEAGRGVWGRELYHHSVLTGWHIYGQGILAKLIVHRTIDSEIHSRYNSELMCYPPIDEGALIRLNSKKRQRKAQPLVCRSIQHSYCDGLNDSLYHVILYVIILRLALRRWISENPTSRQND